MLIDSARASPAIPIAPNLSKSLRVNPSLGRGECFHSNSFHERFNIYKHRLKQDKSYSCRQTENIGA